MYSSRHAQLIQAESEIRCLAAACAIQFGCLEEAVVLLDIWADQCFGNKHHHYVVIWGIEGGK